MPWYDGFNLVEAAIWGLVAVLIPYRAAIATRQQAAAVALGSLGFLAFGVTDLLEIGRAGQIPLWLWGLKIGCGGVILAARYAYRGWKTFRWGDRESVFALACLAAVAGVILVQQLVAK